MIKVLTTPIMFAVHVCSENQALDPAIGAVKALAVPAKIKDGH
jgi:hypothetical protein